MRALTDATGDRAVIVVRMRVGELRTVHAHDGRTGKHLARFTVGGM